MYFIVMMLKYLAVLTVLIVLASSQTWVSRASVKGGVDYYHEVLQEMIYELERRGWSNLKLVDITQNINDNLFNMYVNGTVTYTNGFVVSIQKIDIINTVASVTSRTIDGEAVPFGTMNCIVNFRDMLVGYDVHADLTSPEGQYKATGTFLHTLVQLQLYLDYNYVTKESSFSSMISSVTAGSGVRMNYMPSSRITEALSRRFSSSTFDSTSLWTRNIFGPIILDIVDNKLKFPDICFNNC